MTRSNLGVIAVAVIGVLTVSSFDLTLVQVHITSDLKPPVAR